MKEVKRTQDSFSTYQIEHLENGKVLKIIGGIFEHDLMKFIKDRFNFPTIKEMKLNKRMKEVKYE